MDLLTTRFGEVGYYDSIELRGRPNAMSRASKSWIPYGTGGLLRAWKGLKVRTPSLGARRMFPFRSGWAGLDDVTVDDVVTEGEGSVMSPFFRMAVYVGNGQLSIDGVEIDGAIASSIVRLLLNWGGSYNDPRSGPFTAGISEPSAPGAFATGTPSSIVPNWVGSLSFKIGWYRTTTFGRSRASERSVEIILNGDAPAIVVPLAPTGATNLAIFAPKLGGATQGLHYRMTRPNIYGTAELKNLEFLDTDIEREMADGDNTVVDDFHIDSETANFTQADLGKRVVNDELYDSPTTVVEVISSTRIRVSQATLAAETGFTFSLVAYNLGRDRCVILNYSEGELAAEVAWIEDFVPPVCSHVATLDKVWMYVTGGDASGGLDGSSGSVIQFSNKNNFESVNPFWKMYLPDSIVDVLQRGMDNYVFFGLSTMIIAFQYIETVDTAPAAGTVILQHAGIRAPGNWCLRDRFLYVMTGIGNLIRIGEGGAVDTTFSAAVTNLLRTFTSIEDIVIQSYPDGQGVMVSYHGTILFFNEETDQWATRLAADDFADGNIISAVAIQDQLLVTIEDADAETRLAYEFDRQPLDGFYVSQADVTEVNGLYHYFEMHDGKRAYRNAEGYYCQWDDDTWYFLADDRLEIKYAATEAVAYPWLVLAWEAAGSGTEPIPYLSSHHIPQTFTIASTDYMSPAEEFPAMIDRVFADVKMDMVTQPAYVALHRNYEPMYFENVELYTGASLQLRVPTASFVSGHVGYYVLIQGADGGNGNGYGWYRVKNVLSSTTVRLTAADTEDLTSAVNVTGGPIGFYPHCLFAFKMFRKATPTLGMQSLVSQQCYFAGAYAYALSIAFATNCSGEAMPLNARLGGEIDTYFQGQMLP